MSNLNESNCVFKSKKKQLWENVIRFQSPTNFFGTVTFFDLKKNLINAALMYI